RDAELVGVYAQLMMSADPFKKDRQDIVDAVNIKNFPTAGAHNIQSSATGDVLRVDMATDSSFPNGRPVGGDPMTPKRDLNDVTDIILSLFLTKNPAFGITDGAQSNDKAYLTTFPYLALPWEGATAQGHGKPAP